MRRNQQNVILCNKQKTNEVSKKILKILVYSKGSCIFDEVND